jgi:hypothetical protein
VASGSSGPDLVVIGTLVASIGTLLGGIAAVMTLRQSQRGHQEEPATQAAGQAST